MCIDGERGNITNYYTHIILQLHKYGFDCCHQNPSNIRVLMNKVNVESKIFLQKMLPLVPYICICICIFTNLFYLANKMCLLPLDVDIIGLRRNKSWEHQNVALSKK